MEPSAEAFELAYFIKKRKVLQLSNKEVKVKNESSHHPVSATLAQETKFFNFLWAFGVFFNCASDFKPSILIVYLFPSNFRYRNKARTNELAEHFRLKMLIFQKFTSTFFCETLGSAVRCEKRLLEAICDPFSFFYILNFYTIYIYTRKIPGRRKFSFEQQRSTRRGENRYCDIAIFIANRVE